MSVPPNEQNPAGSNADPLLQIKAYKEQLTGLLNKNYTDPALLIGLNNVVLSHFKTWIIQDFEFYYQLVEISHSDKQLEFNTIKLIEVLWINFHYPIVKFFKLHHKNLSAPGDLAPGAKLPKLKLVEIRVINDSYLRFTKQTFAFYSDLVNYFSVSYKNPLLPTKFLAHFGYRLNEDAKLLENSNVQANLLYAMHKCLFCQGDLLRHRSFIESTYVLPNLLVRNYYNFKKKNPKKQLKYFGLAVDMYGMCILLLPSLNEPYNHLGMIHNLCGDKITAIYWFLRANFTRIGGYSLGISNLNSHLSKGWLKQDLSFFLKQKKQDHTITDDQLNLMLTAIIAFYYMPDKYRMSGNRIFANMRILKLEFIFLSLNFHENVFARSQDASSAPVSDFYLFQLTLLICFRKFIDSFHYRTFLNKYFEFYFKALLAVDKISSLSSPLMFLRLLLNWLDRLDNRLLLRTNIALLVEVLNKVVDEQSVVSEDLGTKPIRNYYFQEDLLFKDFKPVMYQFTDFNDEHLFEANNIDLLNGDFSSLVVNGVPLFLDNQEFNEKVKDAAMLTSAIRSYENSLRVEAVLSQFYRIHSDIVDFEEHFKMKEPKKNRKKPKKAEKVIAEVPAKNDEMEVEEVMDEEDDEEIDSDSSVDEIEDFIRFHMDQLQSQMQTQSSATQPESTAQTKAETWNVNLGSTTSSVQNQSDSVPPFNAAPQVFPASMSAINMPNIQQNLQQNIPPQLGVLGMPLGSGNAPIQPFWNNPYPQYTNYNPYTHNPYYGMGTTQTFGKPYDVQSANLQQSYVQASPNALSTPAPGSSETANADANQFQYRN